MFTQQPKFTVPETKSIGRTDPIRMPMLKAKPLASGQPVHLLTGQPSPFPGKHSGDSPLGAAPLPQIAARPRLAHAEAQPHDSLAGILKPPQLLLSTAVRPHLAPAEAQALTTPGIGVLKPAQHVPHVAPYVSSAPSVTPATSLHPRPAALAPGSSAPAPITQLAPEAVPSAVPHMPATSAITATAAPASSRGPSGSNGATTVPSRRTTSPPISAAQLAPVLAPQPIAPGPSVLPLLPVISGLESSVHRTPVPKGSIRQLVDQQATAPLPQSFFVMPPEEELGLASQTPSALLPQPPHIPSLQPSFAIAGAPFREGQTTISTEVPASLADANMPLPLHIPSLGLVGTRFEAEVFRELNPLLKQHHYHNRLQQRFPLASFAQHSPAASSAPVPHAHLLFAPLAPSPTATPELSSSPLSLPPPPPPPPPPPTKQSPLQSPYVQQPKLADKNLTVRTAHTSSVQSSHEHVHLDRYSILHAKVPLLGRAASPQQRPRLSKQHSGDKRLEC